MPETSLVHAEVRELLDVSGDGRMDAVVLRSPKRLVLLALLGEPIELGLATLVGAGDLLLSLGLMLGGLGARIRLALHPRHLHPCHVERPARDAIGCDVRRMHLGWLFGWCASK